MRSIITIYFILLLQLSGCSSEEPHFEKASLIGQWNCYETGNKNGFGKGIYAVTLYYEHGITFLSDQTFAPRYNWGLIDPANPNEWVQSGAVGKYTVIDHNTIMLHFDSGTNLEVKIIKVTSDELWFSHSYFTNETEYHFKKEL